MTEERFLRNRRPDVKNIVTPIKTSAMILILISFIAFALCASSVVFHDSAFAASRYASSTSKSYSGAVSITKAKVGVIAPRTYTGKQIKPTVALRYNGKALKKGSDYSVSYSNNKNVGKAKIVIRGKGRFKGSRTVFFRIVPKKAALTSTVMTSSGIKLQWKKSASSAGYFICKSTNGGRYNLVKTIGKAATTSWTDTKAKTNGSRYAYKVIAKKTVKGVTYKANASNILTRYYLSRPSIPSVISSEANKASVSWKKNAKASGYEIEYTVGSTSKKVSISGSSTVKRQLSGLAGGKKYTFKMRSYKKSGGKTYYSLWSSGKSVTVKRADSSGSASSPGASGPDSSYSDSVSSKPEIYNHTISTDYVWIYWRKAASSSQITGFEYRLSTSSSLNRSDDITGKTPEGYGIFYDLNGGTTYYAKVRTYKVDGASTTYGTWSDVLTIKMPGSSAPKYTYKVKLIHAMYTGCATPIFIETGNPDQDITLMFFDESGKKISAINTAVTPSDVTYKTKPSGNYGNVDGGQLTLFQINKAGIYTVKLREGSSYALKTVGKVNVIDYAASKDAWMNSVISRTTTSSMTKHEKMSAISEYLFNNSKYLKNYRDANGTYRLVNLLADKGLPYFVLMEWDSYVSPGVLVEFGEKIDYPLESLYSKYPYGSEEWMAYHYMAYSSTTDMYYQCCQQVTSNTLPGVAKTDDIPRFDFKSYSGYIVVS